MGVRTASGYSGKGESKQHYRQSREWESSAMTSAEAEPREQHCLEKNCWYGIGRYQGRWCCFEGDRGRTRYPVTEGPDDYAVAERAEVRACLNNGGREVQLAIRSRSPHGNCPLPVCEQKRIGKAAGRN
jgi:hypothetical protein